MNDKSGKKIYDLKYKQQWESGVTEVTVENITGYEYHDLKMTVYHADDGGSLHASHWDLLAPPLEIRLLEKLPGGGYKEPPSAKQYWDIADAAIKDGVITLAEAKIICRQGHRKQQYWDRHVRDLKEIIEERKRKNE